MSKTKATPVKASAVRSTEAASSTKKPILKKGKANDQSEDADQDYVDDDLSKTKTDQDEQNVDEYENSAENQDEEEEEDDAGQDEEDDISGDGGLIENAQQPDDSEQGRVVKEIIKGAQKNPTPQRPLTNQAHLSPK